MGSPMLHAALTAETLPVLVRCPASACCRVKGMKRFCACTRGLVQVARNSFGTRSSARTVPCMHRSLTCAVPIAMQATSSRHVHQRCVLFMAATVRVCCDAKAHPFPRPAQSARPLLRPSWLAIYHSLRINVYLLVGRTMHARQLE